ncbi:MAG: metalloregulator ArsR/SmtB family transcription factor [Parvularculaceae bacterium]|nr:metalloregulator ArsR/SmtB family transcription factor [Parvularculaceae bacterium]
MTRAAALADLQDRAAEVAGLLKTLSHPLRLLIVCELSEGERSVSALELATGAAQPTLSRDLARLRREGLVTARRESKSVFYRLNDARATRIIDALCAVFAPEPKKKRRRS